MEDILTRLRQDLIGRIGGPISIRLLLQPAQRAVVSASRGLESNAESVSDSDCHGCHLSVYRVSLALSRGGDRHSFHSRFCSLPADSRAGEPHRSAVQTWCFNFAQQSLRGSSLSVP
jgi:hypothetical protein